MGMTQQMTYKVVAGFGQGEKQQLHGLYVLLTINNPRLACQRDETLDRTPVAINKIESLRGALLRQCDTEEPVGLTYRSDVRVHNFRRRVQKIVFHVDVQKVAVWMRNCLG